MAVESDAGSRGRGRRLSPSMVRAVSPKPSRRRGGSSRRASATAAAVATRTAVSTAAVKRGGAAAAVAKKEATRNSDERRRGKPRSALGASASQGGSKKARRTRGKSFAIVCDAESVTHPELLDCINIVEELGTRDVGMIYADWRVTLVRPSASSLPPADACCTCFFLITIKRQYSSGVQDGTGLRGVRFVTKATSLS